MKWFIMGLAVVVVLVGVAEVQGVPITYSIRGSVSEFEGGSLAGEFPGMAVDDAFWGTFSYETDPNVYQIRDWGSSGKQYTGWPGSAFSFTVDASSQGATYSFHDDPVHSLGIIVQDSSQDFFHSVDFDVSGQSFPLERIYVTLWDTSGIAFSSPDVPCRLDLSKFDLPTAGVQFGDSVHGDDFSLVFSIESMNLVPEPSTLLIWSLLAVLGLFRRRRRCFASEGR